MSLNPERARGTDGGPAIKVCIIDDHSVVRMGLKYMISYIPDVECVGEARASLPAARMSWFRSGMESASTPSCPAAASV
mgnify:CR=1 FL=1